MSELLNHMPQAMNRLSDPSKRKHYLKTPEGDSIGSNFRIPNSDFGHFLGWKPQTPEEANGTEPLSGGRVIELALRQEIEALAENAMTNAAAYRNIYISNYKLKNDPGREHENFMEILDAIRKSIDNKENAQLTPDSVGKMSFTPQYLMEFAEKSRQDNYRYLEAQYRAEWASKSTTMISTMMKARHEAIRKSFNDIK